MDSLPPELRICIFGHLTDRKDVAVSRRVSKEFSKCSSQFLVPRVVIAKRADSLQRLWQILQHPDFHRYVTELVWDASAYQEHAASDFENYIEACGESDRDFRDPQSVAEDVTYAALCREVDVHCSPLPWQHLNFHGMEGYAEDHMYAAGMHRGYDDYFRKWRYQKRVEEDEVHFHMLRIALQRLTRLRRIVFADFRQLAGQNEGHDALCSRLFGNTLAPDGLKLPIDRSNHELRTIRSIIAEHTLNSGRNVTMVTPSL